MSHGSDGRHAMQSATEQHGHQQSGHQDSGHHSADGDSAGGHDADQHSDQLSGSGHGAGQHDHDTGHNDTGGGSTFSVAPAAPVQMQQGDDVGSYAVHLDSLTDFGRELDTQIDGITKPSDGLADLSGHPMLLGQFDEATTLGTGHQQSVTEMYDLLGQVKQAIVFARDVTSTVSSGYRDADQHLAGGMGAGSGGDDVRTSTTTLLNDAAAITHHAGASVGTAAGGVTAAVGSTVSDVGAAVGQALPGPVGDVVQTAVQNVGQGVGHVGDTVSKSVTDVLGGLSGARTGGGL